MVRRLFTQSASIQGFPRFSFVVTVSTALCDLLSSVLHPVADRHILRRITRDAENRAEAETDPFRAYATLLAIKRRVPGVSVSLFLFLV